MNNVFKISGLPFVKMLRDASVREMTQIIDYEMLNLMSPGIDLPKFEEYKLWLKPDIVEWCDNLGIKPSFNVEKTYLEIVFDNEQDCLAFQLIWH